MWKHLPKFTDEWDIVSKFKKKRIIWTHLLVLPLIWYDCKTKHWYINAVTENDKITEFEAIENVLEKLYAIRIHQLLLFI